MTSARVCPDWLELMEIDLKLQFKHYSALEAHATVETLGALADPRVIERTRWTKLRLPRVRNMRAIALFSVVSRIVRF